MSHIDTPASLEPSRERRRLDTVKRFSLEDAMKKLTLAACLLAMLSFAANAQQTGQSQQTVRPSVSGNSATINSGGMTSGNSGSMTGMRDSTTGMSGSRLNSPDSLPAAAPKATARPSDAPARDETPPK
jgi:hypothetical protein